MQFEILKNKNLIQGISENFFGSISGQRKDRKKAVNFLRSISSSVIRPQDLIFAKQVFGSEIHLCSSKDFGKIIKNVDGLISDIPGQILTIITGDCLPVLFFDPNNRAVGIIHGGRECLTKGIIKKTIKKMSFSFQSRPEEILVTIGPHIRKCHYWLKEKTFQKLKKTCFEKYFISKKRKIYFDLTKLALEQLLRAGIKRKKIEDCGICTFCSAGKYFSVRKKEELPFFYKKKKPRMASFIGLEKTAIFEISFSDFKQTALPAVQLLKKGKVIVFPTDTVYGMLADATNKQAVEEIFKIKKRNRKKSLPIFVKNIKEAKKIAWISKEQEIFLKSVWPGKVTAVLKRKKKRKLFGLNKETIALRIPDYQPIQFLLDKTGLPLIGTSANISGRPSSTEIKKLINQFKDQKNHPQLIFSASDLKAVRPSKIIDLTGPKLKILRQ